MAESIDDVRNELHQTRERMASTLAEIESRVSGQVEAVKERLDVVEMIRRHPWPALGIAVGVGLLIGSSGADEKAAAAAVVAAKKVGDAASDAASSVADAAIDAKDAVVEKVADMRSGSDDAAEGSSGGGRNGLLSGLGGALTGLVTGPFRESIDQLLGQLHTASREAGTALGSAVPVPPRATNPGTAARPLAGATPSYEPPAVHVEANLTTPSVAAQGGSAAPTSRAARTDASLAGTRPPTTSVPTPTPVDDLAVGDDEERPEDAIPVPSEMLPVELDVRADAVEAVGGGTHEPPITEGAGDLGAKWA